MKTTIVFMQSLGLPARVGDVYVLLPQKQMETGKGFLARCQKWAEKQAAALVTPCFVQEGRLVMAYTAPGQTVIQSACFLPEEWEDKYQKGGDVQLFDTPHGKLALCCDIDILQPQYARTAALRGCRLLFSSLWQNDESLLLAGPWASAQANCLPIAVAGRQGGELLLPCECTPDKSGRGRNDFYDEEIAAAYRAFPVLDSLNPAFYRRYEEALLQ